LIPTSLRDSFWDDPYFSPSRNDFEDTRRKMLREAKDFWNKVDEDKYDLFDKDESLKTSSLSRQFSNPATDLPRWLMPRSRATESDFFGRGGLTGSDSQVIRMNEDENKLEITLNVHGYRPEELKVLTQPDNSIVIEGKHEEKKADGKDGANSFMHQAVVHNQFRRQYSLPPQCDPLRVTSNLSRDGVLVVTAPKRVVASLTGPTDLGRKVPIGKH
jgi:HSP20 family molecular chaperone IbpA